MEAKELFFQRDAQNKIITVKSDNASIDINWKEINFNNEEEKSFFINTANFIIEVVCSCRGIE